jgi:putative PEP-CTERM system integral membrane protein
MTTQPQPKTLKERVALGLFWSWNLIFLAFMTLGFAPRVLPDLIISVRTSVIPVQYLFYALVLSIVPLVAIILGLTVLRHHPGRLLALGYVVEGPLMLMLAVRFFFIRQSTPGVMILLTIASVGMAAFLWYLLHPTLERNSRLLGWLRLAGLTLMVLIALYASVWITFYALPLLTEGLRWVFNFLADLPQFWRDLVRSLQDMVIHNLLWVPFFILGFLLLIYTATLFVMTPLAVPILSLRAWLHSFRTQGNQYGWRGSAGVVLITVLVAVILFITADQQPQANAFQLLQEPPASTEEAAALLRQDRVIRTGLLNAYLAPFRYISSTGEVEHIRWIYESTFKLDREKAFAVQRMYERVATPLIYKPVQAVPSPGWGVNQSMLDESREAARLYQAFFDQSIVEAERETIVRAVRSTWSLQQAEDAWRAVDDREVYLVQQEITITEFTDWAEVEVFEVYQNQTANMQEVVYYFNLPESAVLTGVWLGDSAERSKRFEFQVSPRGAAQTVYREQLSVKIDPALLEQIGPRQYRLRVFPIPPVRLTWDNASGLRSFEEAPPLYLWMTYRTVAIDKAWPLPKLADKRNVFWDNRTIRLVNGEPLNFIDDDWMPESLPASGTITPQVHLTNLPEGHSVLVIPLDNIDHPTLPTDLRLAVVLDRSHSMEAYAAEAQAALARLEQIAGPNSDVYLTSSQFRGEDPQITSLRELDFNDVLYFGGQDPAQMLEQFSLLSSGKNYDAVLVLTDGSAYELGAAKYSLPVPGAPVWMVHLSNTIPLGYDDGTLEAIQASGGGVVGDVEVALQRLAVAMAGQTALGMEAVVVQDIYDGYEWTVLPSKMVSTYLAANNLSSIRESSGFESIAARRLILAEMQRYRGDLKDLATLDYLHSLAEEYNLVTPYSSMIVLVTSLQRQQLQQMEQRGDRFDREYEPVGTTIPPVQGPLAGVPEPHEWLLLGLAAAFLIYYLYSNKLILKPRQLRQ